eukprot:PRCOL_00003580-RA
MGYTTPEAVAEAVASNSDAALRPTAQQRCGLRHFKDFARRVPRATVAALGEVVRSAAESVVGRGVEVMLLGSYMRGASESGDVDALVLLPPPPNTYAHAPPSALSDILRTLVERGVVEVEENASTKRSPGIGGGGDANGETLHSWSGAGNAPGFGWVRLDIKVYPRNAAPFAITYFCSSMSFNRALRLYAQVHPTALRALDAHMHQFPSNAPRVHKDGSVSAEPEPPNSWKLDDRRLLPVHRKLHNGRPTNEVIWEADDSQAVHCENESAIFEALGLSFVPYAMRDLEKR